ncbi:MAG: Smr/MutS family protein [Acidobacteria bacterium]|nr:Smr/MutS family protein [Acidobacteriota bacterium]
MDEKLNPFLTDGEGTVDEQELLKEAMCGVRPLSFENQRVELEKKARVPAACSSSADVLQDLVNGKTEFEWFYSGEYVEGSLPSNNPMLLRRLREGRFSVQAELDLHGMTQKEARLEVELFIRQCVKRQLTCVRLIHGQGKNSRNHAGILKEKVQSWLRQKRLARHVVAYTSARPVDGGFGALYVLLNRSS